MFVGASFAQTLTINKMRKQNHSLNKTVRKSSTSAMNVKSVILTEDFEGGSLPDNWTQTQASGSDGWLFGSDQSSQYWEIPAHTVYASSNDDACNCDMSADYLITPALDLSSYSHVYLSFEAFFDGSYGSVATVEFSEDNIHWSSLFTLSPDADGWQTVFVNLDQFTSSSSLKLAFHHNDNNDWASGFAIDDVQIAEPISLDASMYSINIDDYVLTGDLNLFGVIRNMGGDNLTSVNINYSVNNGETQTYNLTGLNLAIFDTVYFTHNIPIDLANPIAYSIKAWVSNPNGSTDMNTANDTLTKMVSAVSSVVTKRVFGEEATGTWCGWCPRGAVFMDSMAMKYPDTWIGAAVHNGDPMVVADYDDGIGDFIPGYPSGLVDRAAVYDPSEFETAYKERLAKITPVGVEITNIVWDDVTRKVSFDVTGTFVTEIASELRFNAILVENNVTGTTSQWNQANYYSGGSNGNMGGFEDLPDPVPAADMVYNHVARALFGGWNGTAESLPNTISANETISFTYNDSLPDDWDENNILIIGMVINQNSGEVLNVAEKELNFVPAVYNVTFNVDMNNAIGFDAANDTVNITGSMSGWSVPGSDESLILSDNDGDLIYSITLSVTEGDVEYKYFKNSGWDGGEWAGDPNRKITVNNDTSVSDLWGDPTNAVLQLSNMKSIVIYPNPANSVLFISSEQNIANVEIYNSLGSLVLTINNPVEGIDVSRLNNGVYFVNITINGKTVNKKITIVK